MKGTSPHQATSQRKKAPVAQRTYTGAGPDGTSSAAPNRTGLPDALKSGVESLSGFSLDDVRVHYNSSKPVKLQALAYTQGSEIHVGPGQERHVPHEAWHVVQQKQGRVKPTKQMKGISINADSMLEREADGMGEKAIQRKTQSRRPTQVTPLTGTPPIQMRTQIVKLERSTSDMIGVVDDDLMIRMLEADSVVDANADRLHRSVGGNIETLAPANQRFPADLIRDVTKLYIVGHGSKGKVAGMTPRRLAGNLYPAIYEEVKQNYPNDQEGAFNALSQQVQMDSIDIVACHSAEEYFNAETQTVSTFAEDFHGFVSNLNKSWGRRLSVSGVNGYAFVDYDGNVRAVPEESIEQYRKEKAKVKTKTDRTNVLNKHARKNNAIKTSVYNPPSNTFCFITTACIQARGLADDCMELQTLRAFRDQYIASMANGKEMIKVYYDNAPSIVHAINRRQDALDIYNRLYDVISKCVNDILAEKYEGAFQTYVKMVIELRNQFIPMAKIPAFFYNDFNFGL